MSLKIIHGNIFTSKCRTIVNTVNCVGVMGAGIALEFRLRYPDMHQKYVELCKNKQISIGKLWLYKTDFRWVLNFPTKTHWKHPSKTDYLHAGLRKFVDTYDAKAIDSIAFPLLGADKGGLGQDVSLSILESYLSSLPIDIEIYKYDRRAHDDLYQQMRNWLFRQDLDQVTSVTGLSKPIVLKVMDAMKRPGIMQLNQLRLVKGIGIKTLEKLFYIAQQETKNNENNEHNEQQEKDPIQLVLDIS
jgi:O-acetyl-ADP-ribose deacetylase (regulator of RNase III)